MDDAQVKSDSEDETYISATIHYRETNISAEQAEDTQAPVNGCGWRTRRADYQRTGFPLEAGDRLQSRGSARTWHEADFCGTDKVRDCGWSLWLPTGRTGRTASPMATTRAARTGKGTRQCSMHYIRYDVLYAMFSPVTNTGQGWYSTMKSNFVKFAGRQ